MHHGQERSQDPLRLLCLLTLFPFLCRGSMESRNRSGYEVGGYPFCRGLVRGDTWVGGGMVKAHPTDTRSSPQQVHTCVRCATDGRISSVCMTEEDDGLLAEARSRTAWLSDKRTGGQEERRTRGEEDGYWTTDSEVRCPIAKRSVIRYLSLCSSA